MFVCAAACARSRNRSNVLAHVGAAHEKVNDFLSEEFQIRKQRNLQPETSFDEESKMNDRNQNRNDDLRSILDSDSDEDMYDT